MLHENAPNAGSVFLCSLHECEFNVRFAHAIEISLQKNFLKKQEIPEIFGNIPNNQNEYMKS